MAPADLAPVVAVGVGLEVQVPSPAVTAAIACDDEVAATVVSGLSSLGLSALGDLAVIGAGDEPLGRFTVPALTTVAVSPDAVAADLATAVLTAVGRRPSPVPPRRSYVTVLQRDST